jgi:hypothetical protein
MTFHELAELTGRPGADGEGPLVPALAEVARSWRAQGFTEMAEQIEHAILRIAHRAAAAPAPPLEVFTLAEAAEYLRISPRALQDRADIVRVDVSAPGADRAMWRYRKADLDRFLASRVVNPLRSTTGKEAA